MSMEYRNNGSLAYSPKASNPRARQGNAAPDHAYEDRTESPAVVRPRPRQKAKNRTRGKVSAVFCVLCFFGLLGFLISNYAIVASAQGDVYALEKELSAQQKINEDLSVQLALLSNMNDVQDKARNELGMDFPEQENVQYVALPESPQEAEKKPGAGSYDVDDSLLSDLWNKILSLFK